MSRPNFDQKITMPLNCSYLRNLTGKPLTEVIVAIRDYLGKEGGDTEVIPTLVYDYGSWSASVPRKLTAEQRQRLKQWEAEQQALKVVKARDKIQKLAQQAGLTVDFS
jgi:predicted YcjX-like family ATPase